MTVRKAAIRGSRPAGPIDNQPKKNRALLFFLLTLGTGVVSWMAALMWAGLLVDVQMLVTNLRPITEQPQIAAKTLFPPVPVVHKVIDVFDPPVAGPPSPAPRPDPTPTPKRPKPTPTPHHGDD